jgi:hypothetical protein
VFAKQLAEPRVEQHSIGVQPEIEITHSAQGPPQGHDERREMLRSGQQGFTAMEHHAHFCQPVTLGVLGDPSGRKLHGLDGKRRRATPPTLISVFEDVAMVARQVTSAMDFQNELAEWNERAHVALLSAQMYELKAATGTRGDWLDSDIILATTTLASTVAANSEIGILRRSLISDATGRSLVSDARIVLIRPNNLGMSGWDNMSR